MIKEIIPALEIFLSAGCKWINANHDVIYGCSTDMTSEEQAAKLGELGWYDSDGRWAKFV